MNFMVMKDLNEAVGGTTILFSDRRFGQLVAYLVMAGGGQNASDIWEMKDGCSSPDYREQRRAEVLT